MTIDDFNDLFLSKRASILVSSTDERRFIVKYYEEHFGIPFYSAEHNPSYPWIVLYNEEIVGWAGGGASWSEVQYNFEDFYAIACDNQHLEEIESVEELL